MRNVALDEQRHIGFGVKLLADLAPEDPEVPDAVADLLREVLPVQRRRARPAGLGPLLHGVLRLHARADLRGGRPLVRDQAALGGDARRRAARADPVPVRPLARRARGADGHAAPGRDPRRAHRRRRRATRRRWPRCSTRCGAASTTAPRPTARSRCSGTSPTPSPGTCGSTTAATSAGPGFAPDPDVTYRVRYDDFVDVFARPARPAPGARHRAAAPARVRARAVGGAQGVRLGRHRLARAAPPRSPPAGGSGPAAAAGTSSTCRAAPSPPGRGSAARASRRARSPPRCRARAAGSTARRRR